MGAAVRRAAPVTLCDPGPEGTRRPPGIALWLTRPSRVGLVAPEPPGGLDTPVVLGELGGRVGPGLGFRLDLRLGRRGLLGDLGIGTTRNGRDPHRSTSRGTIRKEPDAALLARGGGPPCLNRERVPVLSRELGRGLALRFGHDPAAITALVDHSHELLTSKEMRKNPGRMVAFRSGRSEVRPPSVIPHHR
jgi:hypothetical protein